MYSLFPKKLGMKEVDNYTEVMQIKFCMEKSDHFLLRAKKSLVPLQ